MFLFKCINLTPVQPCMFESRDEDQYLIWAKMHLFMGHHRKHVAEMMKTAHFLDENSKKGLRGQMVNESETCLCRGRGCNQIREHHTHTVSKATDIHYMGQQEKCE